MLHPGSPIQNCVAIVAGTRIVGGVYSACLNYAGVGKCSQRGGILGLELLPVVCDNILNLQSHQASPRVDALLASALSVHWHCCGGDSCSHGTYNVA